MVGENQTHKPEQPLFALNDAQRAWVHVFVLDIKKTRPRHVFDDLHCTAITSEPTIQIKKRKNVDAREEEGVMVVSQEDCSHGGVVSSGFHVVEDLSSRDENKEYHAR